MELTEKEIRKIAQEESLKTFNSLIKEIESVRAISVQNRDILSRLERLLLGEVGTDVNDTLKARATYAYNHARRDDDAQIVARSLPALKWFEDMEEIEPGQKESKLQSLGKIISFYVNIKWILGVIGVTTVINALSVIKTIIEYFEK